jgi:hypothetical protein
MAIGGFGNKFRKKDFRCLQFEKDFDIIVASKSLAMRLIWEKLDNYGERKNTKNR